MDEDKEYQLILEVLKKAKLEKYHYETIFKEQGFTDEEALICLKEGEPMMILQQLIPHPIHLMMFTTVIMERVRDATIDPGKEYQLILKALKKANLAEYHYETIFIEQGFTDEEALICLKEGEPGKILQQLIPYPIHLMMFTTELAKQAVIRNARDAKELRGDSITKNLIVESERVRDATTMDLDTEYQLILKVLKEAKLAEYHYETIFKARGFTDEEALICFKEGEPGKILKQLIPHPRHLMRFTTELAKQAVIENARDAKEQYGDSIAKVMERDDTLPEAAATKS